MKEMTHREKIVATAIERHGSIEAWKKYQAEVGRKGGKATGESKRRGGSEYYATIGAKGGKAKKSK